MPTVHWYVIHTNPRCEDRALKGLAAAGIEAYAPKAWRWKWIRSGGKRRREREPGFAYPRYLFVRTSGVADWEAIHRTHGVAGIVCMGLVPVRVPQRTVEKIQVAEDMGCFDFTAELVTLRVGSKVVLTAGPFDGYVAVVTKAPRAGNPAASVSTELNFLGRRTAVVVPLDRCEVVA